MARNMRIALYQPEIAGNVGAILRLAACFAVPVRMLHWQTFWVNQSVESTN